MSSEYTFDEVLADAREFVSAEHYKPFRFQVLENDGGIGVVIDRQSKADGSTSEAAVRVALRPEDAVRIMQALTEAVALARR